MNRDAVSNEIYERCLRLLTAHRRNELTFGSWYIGKTHLFVWVRPVGGLIRPVGGLTCFVRDIGARSAHIIADNDDQFWDSLLSDLRQQMVLEDIAKV